jgi:hypothetical protein
LTATAGFTEYDWYLDGVLNQTTTGSDNDIVLSLVAESGSWTAAGRNTAPVSCTSVQGASTSIAIDPLPNDALSVTPSATAVCDGEILTFTVALSEVGVNYELFDGATSISSVVGGNGGSIVLTSTAFSLPGSPLTINVAATNASSGCSVDLTDTESITIEPKPVGTSVTEAAACSGVGFTVDLQANIDLTDVIASTFTWSAVYPAGLTGGVASGTGNITETLTNLTGGTLNAVYTVTPRASAGNLCYGDPFVITVPVTSVPTAPALSTVATNACSDVSFTIDPDTYITNGQTGGSYAWVGSYDAGLTVVTAGTSPGTITETIRNESGGALFATYTVTPTLGGCVAPSFDIRIRIESEPDAVDVTASAQCSDVSYTINPQSYITNGVASSFVWSAAPDPLLVLVSAGAGSRAC